MAQHYPDFYIKKRQRDQRYRRITQIVVGTALFVIIGGVAGFLMYKHIIQPKRQPPASTEQLADERQQLETQSILADADRSSTTSSEGTETPAGNERVNLELEDIEYDPSFPDVHVGVVGSDAPAAIPVDMEVDAEAAEETPATAAESAAETPAQPETSTSPPTSNSDSGTNNTGNSNVIEPPPSNTEENKPAETAKPADEEEKPSPKPEEEQVQPTGDYVYKVYAGSYHSREGAEKAQRDLQALGYQSQVIESGPDFLVKVKTFTDYEQARAIMQKLIDSGYGTAFATRNMT
ncbi:SPOR domain-containing protein [bacterium]|nr:SPOR domain-containing protein [bacterium]